MQREGGRDGGSGEYGFLTVLIGITEHKPPSVLTLHTSSLANSGRTQPFNKHVADITICLSVE